jgi:hypothetical protein
MGCLSWQRENAKTGASLIDAKSPTFSKASGDAKAGAVADLSADQAARHLGLSMQARGMLAWDAFDVVLTPGDLMLLISWKTQSYAQEFEKAVKLPPHGRIRRVRVVRDYGMFDRREAPQYYPEAVRTTE